MLNIYLRYTKFFYFLKHLTRGKIITQIIQISNASEVDSQRENSSNSYSLKATLWKLVFSNKTTKVVRLSTRGYRSRWWLVLHYQTLDAKETFSIVFSRFKYPNDVYRALSTHLWYYV